MGRRGRKLTKAESEALGALIVAVVVAGFWLATRPFVISFHVYREGYRSFRYQLARDRLGAAAPMPEGGVWRIWIAAPAAALVTVGWFLVLVVLPLRIQRERAAEEAALALAAQQRVEAARRERALFAQTVPGLEQRLVEARTRGDAVAFESIAALFDPYERPRAAEIRREGELLTLADGCSHGPPQTCPAEQLAAARGLAVAATTVDRAHQLCGDAVARVQARGTAWQHANVDEVNGFLATARCLVALGREPQPSVAQLGAALERPTERARVRAEAEERRRAAEESRAAAAAARRWHDPGPGWGNRWDGHVGRCRDSHGRFTRCR